jgi:hypothetical protein
MTGVPSHHEKLTQVLPSSDIFLLKFLLKKNSFECKKTLILCRYNWQQFSVVTSDVAGHDDFVQVF